MAFNETSGTVEVTAYIANTKRKRNQSPTWGQSEESVGAGYVDPSGENESAVDSNKHMRSDAERDVDTQEGDFLVMQCENFLNGPKGGAQPFSAQEFLSKFQESVVLSLSPSETNRFPIPIILENITARFEIYNDAPFYKIFKGNYCWAIRPRNIAPPSKNKREIFLEAHYPSDINSKGLLNALQSAHGIANPTHDQAGFLVETISQQTSNDNTSNTPFDIHCLTWQRSATVLFNDVPKGREARTPPVEALVGEFDTRGGYISVVKPQNMHRITIDDFWRHLPEKSVLDNCWQLWNDKNTQFCELLEIWIADFEQINKELHKLDTNYDDHLESMNGLQDMVGSLLRIISGDFSRSLSGQN